MSKFNLIITRDCTDEIKVHVVTDETFDEIEEMRTSVTEDREEEVHASLAMNSCETVLMQTLCTEKVYWPSYDINRIMCLPHE